METAWRWEVGKIGKRAINVLHASWEKAKKTQRMADIEGRLYRMAVDNLTNLANAKGDFLKMAAVNIEDLAEGKIEKIKEEAMIRYNEEEKKGGRD